MLDFMDLDIWNLPYDPVAEDISLRTPLEWQFEFYFHYGFDVIEEDMLKEKCCIQVLRILIAKADTEIDELEQDLLFLQSELAWIENEEWSEIGFNALIEKINCLDISMKSLMNKDKNDVEVHLSMHTQPVERLNEILKALLSNYFCKKDIQAEEAKDAVILNSSSNALSEALNIMDGNKRVSNCSSEVNVRKEMRESSSVTERAIISNTLLKLQEKRTDNIKTVKAANVGVKDSCSHSLKLAAGSSDVEIGSNNSCPQNTGKGNGKKHGFSPKDQRMKQNSSSNCADKGKCGGEKIEVQPTNVGVNNAISDASKHADDSSYKMKNLSNSEPTIVSGEFEEHSSISAACVILDSSMKPMVRKTDPGLKHADVGKNVAAEALRCANGLSGRNVNVASGLGTFSNPDNQQKFFDFTLNAADKQNMKELKVAASEKVVSLNSSVKVEEKEKNLLQIVKVEAALTETENCALTSLLEQQDKKGKNAIKLPPKEEGKTMPEVEMSEIAGDERKFNLSLSLHLQKEKTKRSIKSNPPILHEVGFTTVVVDSSSSLITKGKKRSKSMVSPTIASLNQKWKTMKKVVRLGECESEEHGSSLVETPNSVSWPLKKTKERLNSPFISNVEDLDFSTSQKDTTKSLYKDDLSVIESSICDSSSEAAALLLISILEKMKLTELQDLAKRLKLAKYHKLSKNALLQLLAGTIGDSY